MKAIKYPFTLSSFGVVNTTSDIEQIYLDRLLTLLSTHIGQRPVLQEYGTDFGRALFETEGVFNSAVESAISTAVKRWMPDVKLLTVSVDGFEEDGIARLTVSIQIPNGQVLDTPIKSGVFKSNGIITSA